MTGSGSAYYIWCESALDAELATLSLKQKGFNCSVVQSVPVGIEVV